MAKKGKNRRLNITRKREKRRQKQKSKRKQSAFQKQRALQTTKSDEALLQAKIADSKLLLDEPEFEDITFDHDLLRQKTVEVLESERFASEGGEAEKTTSEGEENLERLSEVFRFEVLQHLITVEFINTVSYALRACETRLKRIGYREKAETALVARSLFEYADPEALAFHPLIFGICARTLEEILANPQSTSDAVTDVFSDVLEASQSPETEELPEISEDPDAEPEIIDSVNVPIINSEPSENPRTETEIVHPTPEVLPETLKAKALYKNADGLEIRNVIEFGNGYRVVRDSDSQVEFTHMDGQRYIVLTTDRLLLQCSSKELLDVAMVEVEALCDDALFYLARTVDDT